MSLLPTELYEVQVYNKYTNELYAVLRGWYKLTYAQRVNSPWNYKLEFDTGRDNTALINTLTGIEKNFHVLIYRTNPYTKITSLVYYGLHETTVDQITAQGTIKFTLYGRGYTSLLERRQILPPDGEDKLVTSGNAESIMKRLVEKCFIDVDTDRKLPGFVVEVDAGLGINIPEKKNRYDYLDNIVTSLADSSNLRFGVVIGPTVGTYRFSVREIWGEDRRFSNTAGNLPVIFNTGLGNMSIPIRTVNSHKEKNVVYVGGDGKGEDRTVVVLEDTTAIDVPLDRNEAFTDSRKDTDETALFAVGKQYLEEHAVKQAFTFNVEQTPASNWPQHYGVGDWVTGEYRDYRFDKEIKEISVTVSGTASSTKSESVTLEMDEIYYALR